MAAGISPVRPSKQELEKSYILTGKDYFVLTTNVDHQFQLAGFDKSGCFALREITAFSSVRGPITSAPMTTKKPWAGCSRSSGI